MGGHSDCGSQTHLLLPSRTLAIAATGEAGMVSVFTYSIEVGVLCQTVRKLTELSTGCSKFQFLCKVIHRSHYSMISDLKDLCERFGRSFPDRNTKTFKCWTTPSLLSYCNSIRFSGMRAAGPGQS